MKYQTITKKRVFHKQLYTNKPIPCKKSLYVYTAVIFNEHSVHNSIFKVNNNEMLMMMGWYWW